MFSFETPQRAEIRVPNDHGVYEKVNKIKVKRSRAKSAWFRRNYIDVCEFKTVNRWSKYVPHPTRGIPTNYFEKFQIE